MTSPFGASVFSSAAKIFPETEQAKTFANADKQHDQAHETTSQATFWACATELYSANAEDPWLQVPSMAEILAPHSGCLTGIKKEPEQTRLPRMQFWLRPERYNFNAAIESDNGYFLRIIAEEKLTEAEKQRATAFMPKKVKPYIKARATSRDTQHLSIFGASTAFSLPSPTETGLDLFRQQCSTSSSLRFISISK